ncbi:MAG: cation:proton antiporter [Bacteroidota bacterium]
MEHHLLKDLLIIISTAIFVVFLFHKLKLPSIVGFLLTGMLIGPFGLKLISDLSQVQLIAEVGVILILFSVGIEFSLTKLFSIKRNVFVGGGLQVGIAIALSVLLFSFFNFNLNQAIFIGFLIALSSTALVMKIISHRLGTDSPSGRLSLSISIFQDLAILPMFLFIPLLVGGEVKIEEEIIILFGKTLFIVGFIFVSVKYIMPNLIFQIAKTRIKELFILVILSICIITVWISSLIGISLALGGFIAGLVISETEYSEEALSNIEPFKEVFASFFFVSVGMLLDINFLLHNYGIVLLALFLLIAIKFISAFVPSYLLTKSIRASVLTGLTVAQIGEFAFVLAITGISFGLIDDFTHQLFLATTVLSITINPIMIELGMLLINNFSEKYKKDKSIDNEIHNIFNLTNHLIIIGFGLNGRNLAAAAKFANIPYSVIEMNPVTVREESKKGERIIFGDATRELILSKAGIATAKIVVSTIPDPIAERSIAKTVKRMNPNVYLIIRTRYDREMEPLYSLGVDEVIPEEFETSIEIFTRVLHIFNVPSEDIEKFANYIRGNRYELFRNIKKSIKHKVFLSKLSNHRTYATKVNKNSFLDGKSLLESDLRGKYSTAIIAVQRSSEVIINPPPDFRLQSGDIILLFGSVENIEIVRKVIS